MNKNDGKINIDKENKKIENIKIEETNKYNFIKSILVNNIGNVIDDFLSVNMNNRLTKYSNNDFVKCILEGMQKAEQAIIEEFEKINNKK